MLNPKALEKSGALALTYDPSTPTSQLELENTHGWGQSSNSRTSCFGVIPGPRSAEHIRQCARAKCNSSPLSKAKW